MGCVAWRDVRAFLFDFDGTLVRQRIDFGLMHERILEVVRRHGLGTDAFAGMHGLETIAAARNMQAARAGDAAAEALEREAQRAVVAIELEAADEAVAIPGARDLLAALRLQGCRVGIVTRNCCAAVERVIAAQDLAYDVLLTRDDVDHVKPDPRHLLSALTLLGQSPRAAVMCGDHAMDILAGKRAGMATVGVLMDGRDESVYAEAVPDLMVRSYDELASQLGVVLGDDGSTRV